jgi:glycosyltransferase involved in cell wall biosynthesis
MLGERHDMARIYPELDLVLHPARQEPLGRVLLEAAACGRAIVATDVGGTREIFPPDALAAVLVAPGSAAELAEAAAVLLGDGATRAALGAAARRRAESAFDIDAIGPQIVEHYRQVLESSEPTH